MAPSNSALVLGRVPVVTLNRYISIPVMFGGLGFIPPATAYNYLCWYVDFSNAIYTSLKNIANLK